MKIHFSIAKNKKAKSASTELIRLYGQVELAKAEVIVAVGGDGAMLSAMRESINFNIQPIMSKTVICMRNAQMISSVAVAAASRALSEAWI